MKPADVLSPVLFIFASDYVTGKVRVNMEGLKLSDTRQLLFSDDDFGLLGDSVYGTNRERKKERKKEGKTERKIERRKERKKERIRRKERKKQTNKEGKEETKKERRKERKKEGK